MNKTNILSEILNGWKHIIFKDPEVEKLAHRRIRLCVDCDSLRPTKTCNICNCYMPAKVRSVKSTCPKNKW